MKKHWTIYKEVICNITEEKCDYNPESIPYKHKVHTPCNECDTYKEHKKSKK